MATAKRPETAPTEDWPALQLAFDWPEQRTYELIRPVVLFGRPPTERAQQTGVSARTIYRKTARFDRLGMAGLCDATPQEDQRTLPAALRQAIQDLQAEHPAFRPHELATICFARFGRRPSSHSVQRILAQAPTSVPPVRPSPPSAQLADPTEQRLHADGWNSKSIAAYLQTSRQTVYATLRRWIDEGVRGLADKPHACTNPVRKADLRALAAVRKLPHPLREYPPRTGRVPDPRRLEATGD